MTISRWILLRMRNVLEKSCRENQNTFYAQQHIILIAFPRQQWLNAPHCYVIRTLTVLFNGKPGGAESKPHHWTLKGANIQSKITLYECTWHKMKILCCTLSSLQKLHKDLIEVMRLFATGHVRERCNRCNTKLCGQGWGWGLKKWDHNNNKNTFSVLNSCITRTGYRFRLAQQASSDHQNV